jgi:hypothetical protein
LTAYATWLDSAFRDFKADSEWRYGPASIQPYTSKFTEALAADLAASGIDPSAIKADQAATASSGYRIRPYKWDLEGYSEAPIL